MENLEFLSSVMSKALIGTLGRWFLELSQLPNFTWWVWHCSAPRLSRKHPEKRSEFRFPPRRILLYIDDDEDDEHEEEHKDDEDDEDDEMDENEDDKGH